MCPTCRTVKLTFYIKKMQSARMNAVSHAKALQHFYSILGHDMMYKSFAVWDVFSSIECINVCIQIK